MPAMKRLIAACLIVLLALPAAGLADPAATFEGRFFRGQGDAEYLQLLDIARRMLEPDEEFQNMAMLYSPSWNGLVEGPKWGAWWIQNSYGPSYCSLPILREPFLSFLVNANELWFKFIGDGKPYKSPFGGWQYTPPDGQLCDAASPGGALHKQGDGRVAMHDFGVEFTAAGLVIQAELLLETRSRGDIDRYLPLLERCANFIQTRRDPKTNCFWVGPAGNLLAPSYAGWKKPDGTYDKALLAGVSVTYIAGLDRLIELEKLVGRSEQAVRYAEWRELARKGLAYLTTDEGYLVRYVDGDGTRHGVYGAARHGYFEATVNHDAVCMRVVDDAQAKRIYDKIASIPKLRPHTFIVPNYPSYDDMYENGGIFQYGMWVNGGHWSTCEVRMVMGYYRLGRYADAAASMKHLLSFARPFRMDNPMTGCGSDVWFKGDPIHLCYDSFGGPAAMVRGLFEYLYSAEGVTLVPHVPPAITRLEQHFPVRLGDKKLYLATYGSGPVTGVDVNGQAWTDFDAARVRLPYDKLAAVSIVRITLGQGQAGRFEPSTAPPAMPNDESARLARVEHQVIAATNLSLRIGADSQGGSRFVGDIRLARVYDRPLSEEQVAELARDAGAAAPAAAGLVAQWRMSDVKDKLVPNSAPGADAKLSARVVEQVQPIDEGGAKALRLAGGYLEVPHDERLGLQRGGSLEAWIRPGKLGDRGGRIIDKCIVGTSTGYTFDSFPAGQLRLIVEGGALTHPGPLSEGKWAHVAATVAPGGQCRLFINGKAVTAADLPGSAGLDALRALCSRARSFLALLHEAHLGGTYEAAHARLVLEQVNSYCRRMTLQAEGKLARLKGPAQAASERQYLDAASRLAQGLERVLASYATSSNPQQKKLHELWMQAGK